MTIGPGPVAVSGIVLAGGRSSRFGSDKLAARVGPGILLDLPIAALASIASEVVAELQRREPGRTVAVTIEPDQHVLGDRGLLLIVLENLIGNAWKFTSKKSPARIEFGASNDRSSNFYIRDNGAGFDDEAAAEMFAPFRRLHQESDFPGTGIGLSIVQRIIRRHGGTIAARGQPGAGATFSFTL